MVLKRNILFRVIFFEKKSVLEVWVGHLCDVGFKRLKKLLCSVDVTSSAPYLFANCKK